ncbi:CaiB/BaiF CoA transferase family protein [Chloroflexota bacterium]
MTKEQRRISGESRGPLEDVRILDLTRVTGAPYGSLVLADLGAEVILIEPPQTAVSLSTRDTVDTVNSYKGESIQFTALNRNKKSICLDLKSQKGKEVFYDLVRKSDVVFDNFRPGVMGRLGIDYETLKTINPRIISCSVTGYGETGPFRDRPAFDVAIQANCGMWLYNHKPQPNQRPIRPPLPLADFAGGLFASQGIMAALYARERTGKGQKLDLAIQDATLSLLGMPAAYQLNLGFLRDPFERVLWGAFKAKDTYIVVGAQREGVWRTLCQALGREEWLTDPRFDSQEKRIQNYEELVALVDETLSTKNAAEWLKILTENGVVCALLKTIEEALSDQQILERNMVVTIDHARGGQLRLVGNPIKMSGTPAEVFNSPPTFGQHTDAILSKALGYSKEKIEQLRKEQVVA